ncbi:MAG TPA: Rne/Rng family ribonuclease [Galbitalea sp.]|jgi:ribonuclease E|nr:Rne/Rng family ribonuclease [Galbitalea sp.]
MVNEDNSSENSGNTDSGKIAPKRRGKLFGGRAAESAAVAPEPVATAEPGPPAKTPRKRASGAKSAVDHVNADTSADSSVVPSGDDESAPPRRRRSQPRKAANDAPQAAVETKAPARPTTSLLFQAPDIAPLPPLPRQGGGQNTGQNNAQGDSAGVRRRSRRRPGEEPREGDNEPNVVVKVRQPRKTPEPITEPQRVKGSTRLEAKKQRRRDGRDAGRRRPVITEAEFLARRESVDRVMVVRSANGRIQIGVLEDGVLVEHYVAKAAEASLIGNVYLGRVQNVLPSMEAAFVDIGRGRNAVLYSGEVDWDAAAAESDGGKNQPRRIELALKPGDRVLVQVTKDPVGHKGARLTSQVSLPGRYLVYVPNGSMNGISRKLPDTERARLKTILKQVLPENVGVIVRTAAEGATEEQLTLDVNRLTSQWAEISRLVETSQAPVLLHSEPDLLIKIVRDVFNEDFQKLLVSGDDAMVTISSYLSAVAPDLLERLVSYDEPGDAFDTYRVSEQIEKALDRKVWLPSGGSLVIDRTEAMTVVDVNTGKFVGSGGNLEETVTKNNLEAAEEIVRQLRLRDIGGIIVVDFIDMVLESNRDLVLRRLVECLSRDRTKHQVAEVTSLGLVQMTRKKLGLGLLESFSEPCEHCAGRGIIVHHDPVTRHRQSAQPPVEGGGRRGRGGKGPASGGQGSTAPRSAPSSGNGTHAITEEMRRALAQVAASTVHPDQAHVDSAPDAPAQEAQAAAKKDAAPKRAGRARGSRGSGASKAAVADASTDAEAPVIDLVELDGGAPARPARKVNSKETEQILDAVLDALPEPPQPGQGRSRVSRRATSSGSGIITSGPAE